MLVSSRGKRIAVYVQLISTGRSHLAVYIYRLNLQFSCTQPAKYVILEVIDDDILCIYNMFLEKRSDKIACVFVLRMC